MLYVILTQTMSAIQQFGQQILNSEQIQQEFINQGLNPIEIFALINDLMFDLETNTEIQNLIIQKNTEKNKIDLITELKSVLEIKNKNICDSEEEIERYCCNCEKLLTWEDGDFDDCDIDDLVRCDVCSFNLWIV